MLQNVDQKSLYGLSETVDKLLRKAGKALCMMDMVEKL